MNNTPQVYLDHAATTPLDGAVLSQMMPYWGVNYGNAASQHSWGQRARHAVERAREQVASCLGVQPREIYWTSGGTESDNWALKGVMHAASEGRRHLVVSAVEHQAVLRAAESLQQEGYSLTIVPVTEAGVVDMEALHAAMRPDTALVSVMAANNLTGVLQPIKEIAAIAHQWGAWMHADAVQMVGAVPNIVAQMGVDLLSLSAHKLYGPQGVGALYVRAGVPIAKWMDGGEQERNKRAGTTNTAGVVGLAAALQESHRVATSEAARLESLRHWFEEQVASRIPDVRIIGQETSRVAGFSYICFADVLSSAMLARLDMAGIAVSAGSACSAGTLERNYVLQAMDVPLRYANGGLRFSMGRGTTAEGLQYVLDRLVEGIDSLRAQ